MDEKYGKLRQILGQDLRIRQFGQNSSEIVLKLCGDCNIMED